ncbi:MAG: hypothetical protein ACE15C_16625 [Phycisphaerae bacterium]
MEIRLESTEGFGKPAEVWVEGTLLTVCDNLSAPSRRQAPGVVENVKFSYMSSEGFTWEDAAAGNRKHNKTLAQVRGWTYEGYGRVVSIMPVVIDFGVLMMEDGNWTTDECLIGQWVKVPIDRLEVGPGSTPDWPEKARPPERRIVPRAEER